MNPIYGNHIGIVVNSNPDPEGRGRVQIFVPHLSTTLYDNWNKDAKDISITQGSLAGLNVGVLQRLQQNLPWAEYAFPLFGSGGTTYADPSTGLTRPSQSSSAPSVNISGINALNTNDKSPPVIDVSSPGTPNNVAGVSQKSLVDLNSQNIGDQNMIKYAVSLGYPESEFNITAAQSDQLNSASNNANVDKYGAAGADTGNFQMNQMQVDTLQKVKGFENVDPRKGSNSEQLQAVIAYLDVVRPDAAANIRAGNFNAADALLNKEWASLPGGNMSPDKRANNTAYSGKYGDYNCKGNAACIAEQQKKSAMVGAIRTGSNSAANVMASATNSTVQMVTNTGTLANAGTRTSKVLDSTRQLPGVDMRHPNGVNSVPLPGTFVWCFFLGGDIQRPIYFAGVSEKNSAARTSTIPSQAIPLRVKGNTLTGNSLSTNSVLINGGTEGTSVLTDINGNPVRDSEGNPVYVDPGALNLLAKAATNANVGSSPGGYCYSNVKNLLQAAGMINNANDLRGDSSFASAYMAADNLTNINTQGGLTEPYSWQTLPSTDVSKAPPGSVVVWDKTDSHPNGHIAIIDSSGNQVSDFRSSNMSNLPVKAILVPIKANTRA